MLRCHKCDFGYAYEDQFHMVGESPLYEKEREAYISKLRKIEGYDVEAFKSWDCEKKAVAIPGEINWPVQASKFEVDRVGEKHSGHNWQRRKERLTIRYHF